MRLNSLILTIALFLVTQIICAPAQAVDKTYSAITCGPAKKFAVRLQTDVTIPKDVACEQIRVWHAIPAYKPWSGTPSPCGAADIRFVPGATVQIEGDKRSTHLYFETNANFAPETRLSYVSSYEAVSAPRTFNSSVSRCSWNDCLAYNLKNPVKTRTYEPAVIALAEKAKLNHDPANTVLELCRYISANIKYDNSVSYRTDDLASTLKYKRGHCGHMMELLNALCACAGIHSRDIVGLSLTLPNGQAGTKAVPDDLGNSHTWGEVYLPRIGWVEIEPAAGEKCFNIPVTYIQNNTSFQNAAVWVKEQNRASYHAIWEYVNGQYQCKYNVFTRITFSVSDK